MHYEVSGRYGTRGLLLIKYGKFPTDTICDWFKKPRADFFQPNMSFHTRFPAPAVSCM